MAYWLRDRGLEAYAVSGGHAALQGAPAAAEGVPAGPTTGGALRSALAALRHRRFRVYSAGVLFSLTGNWVEAAAFGYVVLLLSLIHI